MNLLKIFPKIEALTLIFVCLFLYNNTSKREWRDMTSIIFSAKDIFEQEFGREVRGYSKVEVDEFLDDVIKDYETYAALVKSLRQEIADLKEELTRKPQVSSAPSPSHPDPIDVAASSSMTNFDILKRLNRLEKEVFGKQILDNTDL